MNRPARLPALLLAVAAILALAVAAPMAQAAKKGKKKKTPSTLVITDITLGTSLGTAEVSSRKAKCVKGRIVVVEQNGSTFAKGKTNAEGVAQVGTPSGESVAKLKRKKLSKKKLCKGDSAMISNGLSDPIPVTASLSFEPGVYENGNASPNFFTPSWSSPDPRCLAGNTARVLAGGNVQSSFDTEGQSSAGLGFNFDAPLQTGQWVVQIGSNVLEDAKPNGDYAVSFCETATSSPITINAGSTEAQTEVDITDIPATTLPGELTVIGDVTTTPENTRCEGPGRSVVAQRDPDGEPYDWQDLGDALTDASGDWFITDPVTVSGTFRAIAFTQVMPGGAPRTYTLCAGAQGQPIA